MQSIVVAKISQQAATEIGAAVIASLEVSRHLEDDQGIAATRVALALAVSQLRHAVLQDTKGPNVDRLSDNDRSLAQTLSSQTYVDQPFPEQVKTLSLFNELLFAYREATFEVVFVKG